MPAIGCGPFEFTDSNGRQISIPLSALKFASGALSVDTTWQGETPPGFVASLLSNLSSQGILSQPKAAQPQPAMVITSVDPLAPGNQITVTIAVTPAANLDPTEASIVITITETDTYPLLTLATIESVMGNDSGITGTQPGLAHVVHTSLATTGLPSSPQPQTFPNATVGPTVDVMSDDATPVLLFTLEAKKAGADGHLITADIPVANSVAHTFTLTLSWTKSVTTKLPVLQADVAAGLGSEITIAPPGSGMFSVPAATTSPIALTGGSASAVASATFFNE